MFFGVIPTYLAFILGLGIYYAARRVVDERRAIAGAPSQDPDFEPVVEENRHFLNYAFSGLFMALASVLTFNLVTPLGWNDYFSILLDAAILLFLGLGLTLSWIDLELKILPTKLIYWGGSAVLALLLGAAAVSGNWQLLIPMAIGGVFYFLFYFLIWFWQPRAFGFGDVRLSFFIGATLAFLSPASAAVGFAAAWILALFGIGIGAIFGTITGKTQIAFGPWMILGAFVGIFWATPIVTTLMP